MTDKYISLLISLLCYIIISTICAVVVFGIYTLASYSMSYWSSIS